MKQDVELEILRDTASYKRFHTSYYKSEHEAHFQKEGKGLFHHSWSFTHIKEYQSQNQCNGNEERIGEEEFFGDICAVMTLSLHKEASSGNAYLFTSGQGSRPSVLECLMYIYCSDEDTVDYCLTHVLKKIQKAEMDWHILVVLTTRVVGENKCFPLIKYELCERTGS